MRKGLSDVANQIVGTALIVAAVIVFLAGAIGGWTQKDRLGSVGWIIYVAVIGTLALALGPVIASGVTMRQNGSRRHRQRIAELQAEQRTKFGLDALERQARGDDPPAL